MPPQIVSLKPPQIVTFSGTVYGGVRLMMRNVLWVFGRDKLDVANEG